MQTTERSAVFSGVRGKKRGSSRIAIGCSDRLKGIGGMNVDSIFNSRVINLVTRTLVVIDDPESTTVIGGHFHPRPSPPPRSFTRLTHCFFAFAFLRWSRSFPSRFSNQEQARFFACIPDPPHH